MQAAAGHLQFATSSADQTESQVPAGDGTVFNTVTVRTPHPHTVLNKLPSIVRRHSYVGGALTAMLMKVF
jgi:hypothetical protein